MLSAEQDEVYQFAFLDKDQIPLLIAALAGWLFGWWWEKFGNYLQPQQVTN